MIGSKHSLWSKFRQKAHHFEPVNWPKTIYFNFRFFPWSIARKFPVIFYRSVRIGGRMGKITLEGPIQKGMLSFGKPFERFSRSVGLAEIGIDGELVLKGRARFSADCQLYVGEGARLEIGDRFRMGARGKLVCALDTTIGRDVSISFESQLFDSNFHNMIDTRTEEVLPMSRPVRIGSHNFFGNRCTVLPDTVTPDYCTIASNSVCTKDYSHHGQNVIIGGVPAGLINENRTRDWEAERDFRENFL